MNEPLTPIEPSPSIHLDPAGVPPVESVQSVQSVDRHSDLFSAFDRAIGKHPSLASPLNSITTPHYLAQLLETYCGLTYQAAFDLVTIVTPTGTLGELLDKADELKGIPREVLF